MSAEQSGMSSAHIAPDVDDSPWCPGTVLIVTTKAPFPGSAFGLLFLRS